MRRILLIALLLPSTIHAQTPSNFEATLGELQTTTIRQIQNSIEDSALSSPVFLTPKINASRIPLHYVLKGASAADKPDEVLVAGPVFDNHIPGHTKYFWDIKPEGARFSMPLKQFEFEKSVARSVLRAQTGTGSAMGTAFVVANNIVMTNKHVLAVKKTDPEPLCGAFAVFVNETNEQIGCSKVLFCSPTEDYCFIQMKSLSNGNEICDLVPPLPFTLTAVKKEDAVTVIGNSDDLGITASSAKGSRSLQVFEGKKPSDQLWNYASTLEGSSGSPAVDPQGRVIGINYQHIGSDVDPLQRAAVAVPTKTIIRELKKYSPALLNELTVQ
jgi:V8-like Glu-specific endopeptidase